MAPSHSLNQCWNIVNWTLRNKVQSNFNCNSYIFIQENASKTVVCEMSSILSLPQCVNAWCVFGDYTFKITVTSSRSQWCNIKLSPVADRQTAQNWTISFSPRGQRVKINLTYFHCWYFKKCTEQSIHFKTIWVKVRKQAYIKYLEYVVHGIFWVGHMCDDRCIIYIW